MEAALNGPFGRTSLGPAILTIGRAPTNTLVVNDSKASSRHAEISPAGSGYNITDIGSTNGTFVNEQRLDRNVPRMLNPGDRLRIGDTVFTYEGPDAFQQDATLIAGEGGSPGYQPTVAAPPPFTNYDQGYVPPQQTQEAWGASYQPPQQGYPPPPAAYPSYTPPVQPTYGAPCFAGAPTTTTAPKPNRNLLIGLGAGGVIVVAFLIILFAVILPSTPTKTLDAFCNALTKVPPDYQTAYNQFSSTIQSQLTEQDFASSLAQTPISSCTHGTPNQSGDVATATITLTSPNQQQPASGNITLIKENGTWKISTHP